MEEKTLRGALRPMKRRLDIPRATLFLLLAALLLFCSGEIAVAKVQTAFEPGRVLPGKAEPGVASGIRLTQAGNDTILMWVAGRGLPHPRIVPGPGVALILEWDGVRFPENTDKRDWWNDYGWDILRIERKNTSDWWREYHFPLVQRITATSTDQGGVRLSLTGPHPLKVEKVLGMPGSDQIALTLKIDRPLDVRETPTGPRPLLPGDPLAIRTPVMLEFRDASVKDIFRMLARLKNLNLLLDASVPDTTVTLSFNGVPFAEAFSYLMRMNDLTYAMAGKTLIVGKAESIGRTMGREITRGYRLVYGDLGPMPGILTGLITLSTPPVADARMRTLYVTATPEQHREVSEILSKIDNPGRQIMIQAQIMEVNSDASQELESLVSAVYDQWVFSFAGGQMKAGYDYANKFFAPDFKIPAGGLGMAGGGKDGTFYDNLAANSGLKMLTAGLRALEASGKGKVLANPSIITIDGKKARVDMSKNYKYVSGRDDNGNPTLADESAGPILEFTPTIGRDGMVTLEITIQTGEIVEWKSIGIGESPVTTRRNVQTTVRVRDGEPFVVGGLFQENRSKGVSRIPILGYIPLLGDLFKTKKDIHNKSEVAMVIIPQVLGIPESNLEIDDLPAPQIYR